MADHDRQLDDLDAAKEALALATGKLIAGAFAHHPDWIAEALKEGADIDALDTETGLCALHIAVGSNDLTLCQYLVEECGASFFPDKFGRWPSLIAAECRTDEALGDYIVAREAEALSSID